MLRKNWIATTAALVRTVSVLGVGTAAVMLAPHAAVRAADEERKPPAAPSKPAPEPTEAELAHWLLVNVPEVDLDTISGTAKGLLAGAQEKSKQSDQRIAGLVRNRADLRGLPVLLGESCRTDPKLLAGMQETSRLTRQRVAREPIADIYQKLRRPVAVPALQQVLQVEDEGERLYLADALATIANRPATQALARRALFDLSAKVRREAVAKLRKHSADDYRAVLLQGLRYPWAPAAHHAAEALITLEDREAVPELLAMLDSPDPDQPVQRSDGRWEQPQVVRVNHLRNCLLCHAASTSKDEFRGQIPTPGIPLPPPLEYYAGSDGDFVRADVVYLRQDFSVKQPVENHGVWPKMQRYDYLVRKLEITEEQAKASSGPRPQSPQRAAVLHALRGLTGLNEGDSAKAWKAAVAKE